MLQIKDFSDVEALYHEPNCCCSEACRRLSAEERAMAKHNKSEELMKLCLELEGQIEKGKEDGSITTQRANNLKAVCKGLEEMSKGMRVKGMAGDADYRKEGSHMADAELKVLSPMEAGTKLHILTMQELKRNPKLSYREAQARTFKINGELVRWYAGLPEITSIKQFSADDIPDPDAEVLKRMHAARAQNPDLTLSEARHYVLDADPALKAKYTGCQVIVYG